jgi:hypothetical protein
MKEDSMWIDIGPGKTALLRRSGFDIFRSQFVKRGKGKPWILEFEHVRDTPLAMLRAELSAGPK